MRLPFINKEFYQWVLQRVVFKIKNIFYALILYIMCKQHI